MNKAWMLGLLCLMGCGSDPTISGIKGDTGDRGPMGMIGVQGPTGSNGLGLTISSGFSCTKVSGGFNFHYNGITYSTGDAWVECDAAGSSFQVTGTRIYKASQIGATTFSCIITMDSEGVAASGFWAFSANAGKKAVYNDSGSPIDQSTVAFAAGDCTLF